MKSRTFYSFVFSIFSIFSIGFSISRSLVRSLGSPEKLFRFFLFFLCIFVVSCRVTPNDKGYEYFPDMAYTGEHEAGGVYEYYDPNQNFKDGKTAQVPPKGTVPRGLERHYFPDRGSFSFIQEGQDEQGNTVYSIDYSTVDNQKKQEDAILSGKELKNPLPITPEVLKEGKKLYATYCQVCHAQTGKGDTSVGKLLGAQNLLLLDHDPNTSELDPYPEGRFFYVITMGNRLMPGYANQLSEEQRWILIHYLEEEILPK